MLDALTFNEIQKLSEDEARSHLERIRWPNGPLCPRCSSVNVTPINGTAARAGVYRCRECRNRGEKRDQFTVTVGTIFEDSKVPLAKWLMAFHLMCASKKGVSALQLKRMLGLGSYQTAWFVAHRVRCAMECEPLASLLKGVVEADETYVGGRPRRKGRASMGKVGRGTVKAPVVAIIEREGRARVAHIEPLNFGLIHKAIKDNVDLGSSALMTDEYGAYPTIGAKFKGGHHTVKHSAKEYARGDVHVNTCESFFALFKRGVHGTFHHVSKRHLHRYLSESAFRWDHRQVTDAQRTRAALQRTEGRRLTLKDMTR